MMGPRSFTQFLAELVWAGAWVLCILRSSPDDADGRPRLRTTAPASWSSETWECKLQSALKGKMFLLLKFLTSLS